jgi:hypothetical protein
MQIANIMLSLGGDHGNQVYKHSVTAAEIAVLRAIHGDDAVKDVEPIGDVKRSHREERGRLIETYGGAKIPDTKTPIVESLFPGVAARVFENLHELDLPDVFFKATGRLTSVVDSAAPTWDAGPRNDGPTIAEWVAAGYAAGAYPPSGYTSKSTPEEIAAAVAAEDAPAHDAPIDDADDGVGEDIDDEHAAKDVLG